MKKFSVLFSSLLIIAFFISCEKEDSSNSETDGFLKSTQKIESVPVSNAEIMPYIIPGANRGGNRTCAEVTTAFGTAFDMCGSKLDFGNFDADPEFEFSGTFPEGLNVTVNGKFISFSMNGCIPMGDKTYKVGAVIVKGSKAANVYSYPEGTLADGGLAAPPNASGSPAGLSNLTFCFIECTEEPELIIAIKSQYWDGGNNYTYALSSGNTLFTERWCEHLGINPYSTSVINLMHGVDQVGTATIDINLNTVTVDMIDGLILDETMIFIGTSEDLQNNATDNKCPAFNSPPWIIYGVNGNTQIITIN